MITGYGRWALALSAQLLVPMVFVLGLPPAGPARALQEELLLIAGGLAYIALAIVATRLISRSDRRMMASESIREHAAYLRAIARFTDPAVDVAEVYGAAIRQQAALADQLQAARALLLERPRATPERVRLAATIGVLLDAFDALVAAQCDLPAFATGRRRARSRRASASLCAPPRSTCSISSLELLTSAKPRLPPGHAARPTRCGARPRGSPPATSSVRSSARRSRRRSRGCSTRAATSSGSNTVTDDSAAAAAIGGRPLGLRAAPLRPTPARAQFARLAGSALRRRLTAAMVSGALVAEPSAAPATAIGCC